jgi:hypothetical protein
MTPEIVSQLIDRMQSQPRPLPELHRAAVAAGSGWSEDQVALLLKCLPQVTFDGEQYGVAGQEQEDPATQALLDLATPTAMPAAVFVSRMPRGVVVTPAALCEIARNHPDLELVGSNRIRRR